ncbi:MAG: ATP-dependent sacrificial sulfur transferase LarE [Planctomycetaceae bacterium]|nr:ATP-dependent sacrificial sulfur transferase LarE [Planctomycetaceae bacterium]
MSDELSSKRDRLLDLLRGLGSCAVAFSGGLDSAVLAKATRLALGDRAVAILGRSASLAAGELDAARRIAAEIGIHLEVVETGELRIEAYQANQADRCYHCKNELFRCIEQRARELNLAAVIDGGNQDDLGDYRPGLQAAKERRVRSPLAECGLTKTEIRRLAELWKLSIWNKSAMPCLSSRVAYGQRITPERLAMIDQAERFLRERGFLPLRVRYHSGDVARVEVSLEQLPRLAEPQMRREVVERLKSLGFRYVSLDLEGFRSGSMNAGIRD